MNKNYKDIRMVVFGISVKTILKSTVQYVESLNMSLSALPRGMYILNIVADNHFYSTKVIKT
ncbi:T9SS type A sorting domain-containing protein [Xanthomarina sp. F2636L]|uniref:T9SS type A sorting domain-containing protein n=1 Tax=Xanthomarina sp. F2636L TaxID=2996018 RepID=UPI00225E558B|nr:T9SS type A sorting domain-containing protein [Xanthomarina sp. F2636L]MCX7549907.1 T9SS type A sorting domain-containing protein [Xanthomarina sp. F2636L]